MADICEKDYLSGSINAGNVMTLYYQHLKENYVSLFSYILQKCSISNIEGCVAIIFIAVTQMSNTTDKLCFFT